MPDDRDRETGNGTVSFMRLGAAILLVALLTSAAYVGMSGAQTAPANDGGSADEYIQVSADGTATAEPDKAVLTVAVEARGDDPSSVRSQVAENVSSMKEALSGIGVGESQIKTVDFTIGEERERRPPREGGDTDSDPRYVASHEFEIELNGTDGVGNVIDTAVNAGATRVSDVRFTLSDERRQEVRSRALEKAMDNARSQADTIAGASGLQISGVRSVSTVDSGVSPVQFEGRAFATEDASGGAGTSVSSGPVSVNAQVNVDYNLR